MSQSPESPPAYVSLVNEVPEDLYEAMCTFVTSHPNWDQYRVMQVALAGFLFQQGSRERAVACHYLDGLFDWGAAPEPGMTPARPSQSPSRPIGAANPAIPAAGRADGSEPAADAARLPQPARPAPVPLSRRHHQGPPHPPHRGR